MYYTYISSPIGTLGLAEDGCALTHLSVTGRLPIEAGWREEETALLKRAQEELAEYFARERKTFDLPLRPAGTSFQKKAWETLLTIPYGTTISYGEQARRMGARSARPVGGANGKNPIAIVIPCHRVLAANGCLQGYTGGLFIKKYLLHLEGATWKEKS